MGDGVDAVDGSGARLVEVSVPAQRQRMALRLNGVLGLAFLGATAVGLIWAYSSKVSSGGAASVQDDALTVAMVFVVAVVWGWLLAGSVRWERGLAQPRTLAVPIRALVDRGGRPQLAASEAEAVCDQLSDEADLEPPWWMATGAGLLISIGLAGTFLGLSLGLLQTVPLLVGAQASNGSDAADVTAALMPLLEGAKLAFVKSLAGVVLGTLWTLRMAELRHFAAGARAHLRTRLLDTFPPVTPEALLSELLASRDEDRRVHAGALSGAAAHVTTTLTEAIKAQANTAEAGAQKRSEDLAQARRRAQTELLAALAPLPALKTAAEQMAEDLRELRGGDEASVHALVGKLDALKATVDDAAAALPDRIGTATGSSVSTGMKASFTDIADALTSLSSQGGEAVGDALKESVGRQTSALSEALEALTASLSSLPQGMAASGVAARQVIEEASSRSASKLTDAATTLQSSAEGSAEQLRVALAEVQDLVNQLRDDGQQLHGAFTGVATPLQALPEQIKAAGAGIEQAGRGLQTSGVQLTAASDRLATEAKAAAGALATGGRDLAQGLTEAREQLGKGFTAELVAIQGALGAQLTAQAGMLAGTKAQHELMARSADMARQRLESLNDKSTALVEGIEQLRQTCADTVAELQAAAGDQRSGADQAVQDLLSAVAKFSESLDKSQGAVHAASLAAVASTKQVTTDAASRVAEALVQGADRFEQSMGRVEQVGQRLDAHGQALEKNLSAAQGAAAALTGHGEALVRSAGALKAELAEVVSPLSDARSSLMTVPGAVNAAVTALGTERTALSGLSTSLKDQAELVRMQERELAKRTAELGRVTDALGGQIAQHVDRLTKAQEKVAVAWAEAVAAGDERHEERVKAVASYAARVEQALGLGSSVKGLTEALRDVADSLADMRKLPAEVASLHASITKLEAALDGGAG